MHQLASQRSVLGLLVETSPDGTRAAARRLTDRYRAVPGLEDWTATTLDLPGARSAVIVVGSSPPTMSGPTTVLWGQAVGRDGAATEAELRRALDAPETALDLAGVFVLLHAEPDRVRVVTSSAFAYTLRRSGRAFATRAVAAVTLADRPLRVDRDLVPIAVAYGASPRNGDALEGSAVCPEASVVDVGRGGTVTTRVYADLAERIGAPGPAPDAARLRAEVSALAVRHAAVPGARLGLTAGRDSSLIASCLADAGGAVPTFTMGSRRYEDVRAARSVAAELGWPHVEIPVGDANGHGSPLWPARLTVPDRRPADWLVRLGLWTEGLQHPRDALVGWLQWDRPRFTALTGHGGEVGRAFYWDDASDEEVARDPLGVLVNRGTTLHLPEAARRAVADELAPSLAQGEAIGRTGAGAVDVLYAQRQSSWMHHKNLPTSPFDDVLPVLLNPRLVGTLLDVPAAQRRRGAFFDAALLASRPEVRRAGLAEAQRGFRPWRALGPLNPYGLRNDWPLLTALLQDLEPGGMLVRDVIGDAWWRGALAAARETPGARAPIWNAVAVEVLHRAT